MNTVFAHRISREFTFREFETLTQKEWLPILSALRHNEWFTKITIENTKLVCLKNKILVFLSSNFYSQQKILMNFVLLFDYRKRSKIYV